MKTKINYTEKPFKSFEISILFESDNDVKEFLQIFIPAINEEADSGKQLHVLREAIIACKGLKG